MLTDSSTWESECGIWYLPRSWWRRKQCFWSLEGCHGYSQVTCSGVLTRLSVRSCPPSRKHKKRKICLKVLREACQTSRSRSRQEYKLRMLHLRLQQQKKRFYMCILVFVYLAAMSRNHPDVSRNPVSTLYFNQISSHHFFCVNLHLLTLTDHQSLLRRVFRVCLHISDQQVFIMYIIHIFLSTGFIIYILVTGQKLSLKVWAYLRHHVLERLHNFGTLGLLKVWEASSNDNDSCEDNT